MSTASRILITPECRMSFPNLVKPRAFQQGGKEKGEPRYSVEMIFDPNDLGKFKAPDEASGGFVDVDIRQVAADVAKEKWPDINVKESVQNRSLGWLINDGAAKADARKEKGKDSEHYRGMKIISAKASVEYPPRLLVPTSDGRKTVMRGLDSDESLAAQYFVGGNYAIAEVNVKAVDTPQGRYVTCYLNSIKFTRQGERLGGASLMERFEGIEGGESDHDPTEGMDDDIPF